MHPKKKKLPLDLTDPLGGLGTETPPLTVWTFWCQNKKFNSPLKKNSTQAQLKLDHVALQASFRLKIRAHTLMQDTTSSY
jgi:hypothetical protein